MDSENLFLILMILDLLFVFFCFKLGPSFVAMSVIANIMFTNMVSSKIVTLFGYDTTVANVFYAPIFLATDLLSEHYGKKYAVRAVWLGFFSLSPIIFFAPIVKLFEPTIYSKDVSDALSVVFNRTIRISVASLIAYLIANLFDVWFYEKIKQRLPSNKWLWLRNNGSTFTSQLIDNSIFTICAFAYLFPLNALCQIFISGYIIKVIIAISDTPFVYLAKQIKPLQNDVAI